MTQYRIGARLGNYADLPALVVSEIGYIADKKTYAVGDDTSTPPLVITHKSSMSFEYAAVPYVKYNRIELFPSTETGDGKGTIDGVTPSALNAANGFLARTDDNQWAQRTWETDQYLAVDNPNGVGGNPKIKITADLLQLINNTTMGLRFTYGEDPPTQPLNGEFFWSTIDELLYCYITDGNTAAWVDIATGGNGISGSNVNRTYVSDTPPSTAFVGDKFFDSSDSFRLYMRMEDEGGLYWKEILTDQF